MVIWYRILQVVVTLGIMYGVGAMYTYVYDTNHYTYALFTLVAGSIVLTLMVVLVGAIQTRIMELKEED